MTPPGRSVAPGAQVTTLEEVRAMQEGASQPPMSKNALKKAQRAAAREERKAQRMQGRGASSSDAMQIAAEPNYAGMAARRAADAPRTMHMDE